MSNSIVSINPLHISVIDGPESKSILHVNVCISNDETEADAIKILNKIKKQFLTTCSDPRIIVVVTKANV